MMVFVLACILMASIAGTAGFMWLRRPPVEWTWTETLDEWSEFMAELGKAAHRD